MSEREGTDAPPAPHVCEVDHETSDGPDHHGHITITGWCICDTAMYVHTDSVL